MNAVTIPGVDLGDYDPATSIGMREACKLIQGRSGAINLEVCRRWANPVRGCKPCGPDGPTIILPSIKLAGSLRTMKPWVLAFEKMRQRLAARTAPPPPTRSRRSKESGHRRAEALLDGAGVGMAS